MLDKLQVMFIYALAEVHKALKYSWSLFVYSSGVGIFDVYHNLLIYHALILRAFSSERSESQTYISSTDLWSSFLLFEPLDTFCNGPYILLIISDSTPSSHSKTPLWLHPPFAFYKYVTFEILLYMRFGSQPWKYLLLLAQDKRGLSDLTKMTTRAASS
jgi:hypothetical protein